jgi:hypothetical protein
MTGDAHEDNEVETRECSIPTAHARWQDGFAVDCRFGWRDEGIEKATGHWTEIAQSAHMSAPSAIGSVTRIEAMNTYAISIQLIF